MVTETKENVNKAFDTFNDGLRTAVDASQRTQETWFNIMRDAWRQPGEVDRVLRRGERMMNEWMPFVGGTMNTMMKAYDTNMRAGMDIFKTVFDTMSRGEAADVGKTTRQVWDATFEAMRTNFDMMNRVSARTMENCAAFCETAFASENGNAPSNGNGRHQQPQTRPSVKNEKVNAN